eukprot:TRINITY_DN1944_c2_g1_i1.p1 TRINITY_DN1944_c2_g1~~TRINITY_DN1944_c2_g1_i1.p1  ORF type:complete len:269 (-),score=29.30 TRINITY_DN1944_c2_g1_i1:93-899(-)
MALPVLVGAAGIGLSYLPGFSSSAEIRCGKGECRCCKLEDASFVICTEEGKSKCRYYPYGTRQQADKDFNSLSFQCKSRIMYTYEDGVLAQEIRRQGFHSFSFNTIRRAARRLSLHDKVFVQSDSPGMASFHFVTDREAFISYESDICSAWKLDDGSSLPPRKYFEDAHFDPKSRTFRGNIIWAPTSFCGDSRWEYEMGFDDSMSEIVTGRVLHYTPGATDWNANQILVFSTAKAAKEETEQTALVLHYKRYYEHEHHSSRQGLAVCV